MKETLFKGVLHKRFNLTKNEVLLAKRLKKSKLNLRRAEMVEWFKAHAWKACDVHASAGSNLVLCAIGKLYEPQK